MQEAEHFNHKLSITVHIEQVPNLDLMNCHAHEGLQNPVHYCALQKSVQCAAKSMAKDTKPLHVASAITQFTYLHIYK